MIKISTHAMQRYARRVMGIEDGQKALEYAKENKYEVVYKIIELLNGSTLLYENYHPTRKDGLNYYLNGELLIKVTRNNELESMYYIKLHEDPEENSRIITETVSKITENQKRIKEVVRLREKQDKVSSNLQFMIRTYGNEISEDLLQEIENDFTVSVMQCKEYAAEEKKLRTENRELMTGLFKKN